MLVGTHALAVLANVLGVRWEKAALRTQDNDLAAETSAVALAMPGDTGAADVWVALQRLERGFLPVPPFNPKHPSTSFRVRKSLLRVDLLTPARGRASSGGGPVFLRQWNAAATPLRYLDYLLETPVRAAVVGHTGVLVNVPAPARLALHKLLTASERDAARAAKAEKDLAQAGQLLRVLAADRPGDLELAWEALARRSGAAKRVQAAAARLRGIDPEGHAALAEKLGLD